MRVWRSVRLFSGDCFDEYPYFLIDGNDLVALSPGNGLFRYAGCAIHRELHRQANERLGVIMGSSRFVLLALYFNKSY